MPKTLALDFDGVISDGLNECVLVSYYAKHAGGLAEFSSNGMSAIPPAFISRFAHCRAFAKHLGHFCAVFHDGIESVSTQTEFEELFCSIPEDRVERFVRAANRYRAEVRESIPERWLSAQGLYPGVADFLRANRLPTYIVTAKDAHSVLQILSHAKVEFASEHVFGELRDKRSALAEICSRQNIPSQELAVIDDNVLNVLAAREAGHQAFWALWGYRVPDHAAIADAHGLATLTLEQLISKEW